MGKKINYSKRLSIWKTIEKYNPGKLVVWELVIDGDFDLLVYDKHVSSNNIIKDIESYYGKSMEELGCTLRALSAEEVYERFC